MGKVSARRGMGCEHVLRGRHLGRYLPPRILSCSRRLSDHERPIFTNLGAIRERAAAVSQRAFGTPLRGEEGPRAEGGRI